MIQEMFEVKNRCLNMMYVKEKKDVYKRGFKESKKFWR